MKFLRYLKFLSYPLAPLYYSAVWSRNLFYDKGIRSSKLYDFPIICVGNLSSGGTGKSPMVEYLVRLLKKKYKIATLSRGYGRKTTGYVLGNDSSTALTLGDEPLQFYLKFGNDILVSVCEDRQKGIAELLDQDPLPEVIILDDAFQHRKVVAGMNILLTTYSNPFMTDHILPYGNLREPRIGYERAQIIVVTKCPDDLSENKKAEIINHINPGLDQEVFFSSISYPKTIIGLNHSIKLKTLLKFTLVTGVANAKPLIHFLKSKGLNFDHKMYKDHHEFTDYDVKELISSELILTTEKDYMRLKRFDFIKKKLYYIPIKIKISDKKKFNDKIKFFVSKTS